MTHHTKVMIRKTLFIFLTFVSVLLFLISMQTTKQYHALQQEYMEQVIKYNKLSEQHISLTDQHWSLQQRILKDEAE